MQNIKPWTDYIASLPDEKFFFIMRLYLGEIKTPFNKVRLMEQLASFLRNKDSIENIISLLDKTDIEFLTAIKYLPGLTVKTVCDFFSDEYSESIIYARLSNLRDRLLIYTEKSRTNEEEYFRENPHFIDELSEYFNPERILPPQEVEINSLETPFSVTPNFLAAFISYINTYGLSLKADGKFKKVDLSNLEKIFGSGFECLQSLITAFINLSLVREGEKYLEIDSKHLEAFAALPELSQLMILSTASAVKLSRESLKRQTQLLSDCLASMPESGCSKNYFLRLAKIVNQRSPLVSNGTTGGVSRFSQLLNMAKSETQSFDAANIMDTIFDSAVSFGLLSLKGTDKNGENLYIFNKCNCNEYTNSTKLPKVLSINGASTVMLLPGAGLLNLLLLTEFTQIVSCSTVMEFEISRKSVSKAFDRGISLQQIKAYLLENANFEIQQNLFVNLDEWHNSYSSAILYKGYILKISSENFARVESNPQVSKHIAEKLAEGVYLLNIPLETDPSEFLKASGLGFMGRVKSITKENEVFVFPKISEGRDCSIKREDERNYKVVSEAKARKVKDMLLERLETLSFGEMQKENLQTKIENGLIISELQLASTAVKNEILEADAMDFQGKIHLVEASIKGNDMLEVFLAGRDGDGKTFSLFGSPVQLIKHEGDSILRLLTEPDKETVTIFISKITHIKRIRS